MVRDDKEDSINWLIAGYAPDSKTDVTVLHTGSGGLEDCRQHLSLSTPAFGGLRLINRFVSFFYGGHEDHTTAMLRGRASLHKNGVLNVLEGCDREIHLEPLGDGHTPSLATTSSGDESQDYTTSPIQKTKKTNDNIWKPLMPLQKQQSSPSITRSATDGGPQPESPVQPFMPSITRSNTLGNVWQPQSPKSDGSPKAKPQSVVQTLWRPQAQRQVSSPSVMHTKQIDSIWQPQSPRGRGRLITSFQHPPPMMDEMDSQRHTNIFAYEELKDGATLPSCVEPSRREMYLSDKEFAKLFDGLTKEDFSALPKWKQTKKKKELGLF